jgi:hypothetical protein
MNAPQLDAPSTVSQKTRSLRLLFAGIACMVGAEAFCILGPLRYEKLVHIICHVIFLCGRTFVRGGSNITLARKMSG